MVLVGGRLLITASTKDPIYRTIVDHRDVLLSDISLKAARYDIDDDCDDCNDACDILSIDSPPQPRHSHSDTFFI